MHHGRSMRAMAWSLLAALASLGCGDDGSPAGGSGDSETTTSGSGTTAMVDDTASSDTVATTGGGPLDDPEWPQLDCDPLVPEYCAYPFPNNVFSVVDESTPTGRRLALSREMLPRRLTGGSASPDAFNERDGFSVAGTILAHLPGATATGLPDPLHIGDSLALESPTVLLDADTGERFPHFSEVDVNANGDGDRSLMIQPAAPLEYGHRYIVALRGVVDEGGSLVPASPAFAALRDGTPSDEPSVDQRRALYEDVFARLADAGVAREELQLAWDFTVSSREHTSGRMLYMRDQAYEMAGDAGPGYEILSVEDDVSPTIFRRIEGEIEVPLFLDVPGPGGVMEIGDDDLPLQNGTTRYPFLVQIPYAALEAPAPAVMFGHGLFGTRYGAESPAFQQFAEDANMILVSLDWIGMSDEDPTFIGLAVSSGDVSRLRMIPDRLQQALVNFLLTARMMRTSIVDDPELQVMGQPLVDATTTYYYGGSQGGIMGGSFMALSTDVERGVLAVPGQPYNLLLERSVDFDAFSELAAATYVDHFDDQMLLALLQVLWDRAEPSGYTRHITHDPLPGTPTHEVLMLVSIGDHQVTTLGAHVMARAVGAVNVQPVNRTIWGVPEMPSPVMGSAMIEHDFGLPPEPLVNQPMREGDDPHGALQNVPVAAVAVEHFLRTGEAASFCDGVCDPD
ncbi:MAG: hypothetical protein H6712_18930 [Myxococcales bacterium]|nr:hypothetical protein [Myxococcales bacterium]MCB9715950.1 hypothetical protein [Myxococcales bacterium]